MYSYFSQDDEYETKDKVPPISMKSRQDKGSLNFLTNAMIPDSIISRLSFMH